MASFFQLILDTLAPQGLTLAINSGADYTASPAVNLAIGVSDGVTTGYQMKIWGIDGVADDGAASWETFSASKSVSLSTGDGLKIVYVKVRDDLGNESSAVSDTITLNSAAPVVSITSGPDYSKISKVAGFNISAFSFSCDVAFDEYKVKVVPSTSSLHSAGTAIGAADGSTNMAGTGSFQASTPINCAIYGADLETAAGSDGQKIIKVFVKNLAGTWNEA